MQPAATASNADSTSRVRMQAARDALLSGDVGDDGRRYLYTDGWDRDDAELGWVDLDVVSRSPRLH